MNDCYTRLSDEKGVGLLEVLVSMVLMSVGLLGMAMMIGTAIQGNVTARDNSVVTTLIKRQIEHYEALDSLPAMPLTQRETNLEGLYSRNTYLIDSISDTTIPGGLCELSVTVSWEGQDQLHHSQTFSTFLVKP
ncbi:MAG: prepilin-type N-terminal cleavage/methylation domain-containing protein [candidate division Zixibacteria bacterium]|nr:prepilin-type N-terminal cleavage/methylation domain-containing protein [candidate division Zixibacteria bacterium]